MTTEFIPSVLGCAVGLVSEKKKKKNLTIIPQARVGHKMVRSQGGAYCRVGYNHLTSNKREWNNCFMKNAPKILDKSSRLNFVRRNWMLQCADNFRFNSHVTCLSKTVKSCVRCSEWIIKRDNQNTSSLSNLLCLKEAKKFPVRVYMTQFNRFH